jgi:predicted nucleotidyltransferase
MGKIDPKIITIIKKFKAAVKDKYGVEKIVLFGSQARGEAKEGSDVDLIIVVKDYDKHLVENLMTEWHDRQHIRYPVDFMQYSKKRFDEMSKGINP